MAQPTSLLTEPGCGFPPVGLCKLPSCASSQTRGFSLLCRGVQRRGWWSLHLSSSPCSWNMAQWLRALAVESDTHRFKSQPYLLFKCVNSNRLFHLSEPPYPHMKNGDNIYSRIFLDIKCDNAYKDLSTIFSTK